MPHNHLTEPPQPPFYKKEKDIRAWLKNHNINSYTIDANLVVHVKQEVRLRDKNLHYFPFQFGSIEESFMCANLGLLSLRGAPQKVVGDFDCSHNQLSSLIGGPVEVGGKFDCAHNELTTLKGGPKSVLRYYCHTNLLRTLEGAPTQLHTFYCDNNQLVDLVGGPEHVDEFFHCSKNQLTSFHGAPSYVGKYVFAQYNDIQQFNHTFTHIKAVLMGKQKNDLWTHLVNSNGEVDFSMETFNAMSEQEKLSRQVGVMPSTILEKNKKIIKI